jgi:hypothetical protein
MKRRLSTEGVALLHAALEKATTSRKPSAATGVKYAVVSASMPDDRSGARNNCSSHSNRHSPRCPRCNA